jgi:type VI secretion system secreted protein VgrG
VELVVARVVGREAISRLYSFQIDVIPTGPPIVTDDFQPIFDGRATLSFGPDREHPIHGVVRNIEILPTRDLDHTTYRFHMVPRLADTRLTKGSWIYQWDDGDGNTPPDIVTKALTEILPEASALVADDDFTMGVQGAYNPREYVVQYEESIFNFVSRQMEHWGIWYYFDHSGEKELMFIGDTQSDFAQLEGYESIPLRTAAGGSQAEEAITSVKAHQRVISKQISLREYNYRTPSLPLVTELGEVDADGIGDVHVTGDHFWSPAEGGALQGVRGQELFQHKLRLTAESNVRGLRPGHHFFLTGFVVEQLGLSREYLVVEVETSYGAQQDGGPFKNRLTLMPYEAVYRPDRITPIPRIYGAMHAIVDAEGEDDGVSAPVDEWGRYKVVMPFDVAGETGGASSCWIRLTTPSTGPSWGFSGQIHTGQEVVIFHIDGDPDRPVMAGAVPNFENPAIVTSQNPNVSQTVSRGQSGFRIRDE